MKNNNNLNLSKDECDLVARALLFYQDAKQDVLTEEGKKTINNLYYSFLAERARLIDADTRAASGTRLYTFYDEHGENIGQAELKDDNEAWKYIYKNLAASYAVVTFESVQ